MNFDHNTVIGFVVLALLFFGYFYFNNQQQIAYQKQKAHQDSVVRAAQKNNTPASRAVDSVCAGAGEAWCTIMRQPAAVFRYTLVATMGT